MNDPEKRYGTLSRLYTDNDLNLGAEIALAEGQAHYLRNVLRKNPGESVRLFNGREGEWLAEIAALSKKGGAAKLLKPIRAQPPAPSETHLLFAPIKKDRFAFLIEKAAELGATHLHPVLTSRTENRHINEERLRAQIIEAAEQCERMDIPLLAPPEGLHKKIAAWDKNTEIIWCYERTDAAPLAQITKDHTTSGRAFLIGPEGGFDHSEAEFLGRQPFIRPVSLGPSILRAETAAMACLAWSLFTRA